MFLPELTDGHESCSAAEFEEYCLVVSSTIPNKGQDGRGNRCAIERCCPMGMYVSYSSALDWSSVSGVAQGVLYDSFRRLC